MIESKGLPTSMEMLCTLAATGDARMREGDPAFSLLDGRIVRCRIAAINRRRGQVHVRHDGRSHRLPMQTVCSARVLNMVRYDVAVAVAREGARRALEDGMDLPHDQVSVLPSTMALDLTALRLTALATGTSLGVEYEILDATSDQVRVRVTRGHESRVYEVLMPDPREVPSMGISTWQDVGGDQPAPVEE